MAAHGITETTTLIDRLIHWRDHHRDTDAFVFYDSNMKRSELTRKELVDLASRFAYILRSSGIGHKDVVANTLTNSLERAVTDMGIILAGAAPINSVPSLTSGEVFFSTVSRSEAKAVVVYPSAPENSDWMLIKEGIETKSGENGKKTLNENKESESPYGSLVFDFRSERAPKIQKAILISRSSLWQQRELPTVPHFLQFLRDQPEKNSFVEKAVTASDNGYLFTTTGTTGMQKIVPRTHSILLGISQVMGQMTPGTLPSMFYTTMLGWNSGFPYMFYLFGSTLVMLDELDSPENFEPENIKPAQNVAGIDEKKGHKENGNASTRSKNEVKNLYAEKSLNERLALYDRYWRILQKERIRFAYLSPDEISGMAAASETAGSQIGGGSGHKLLLVVTGGLPIKHSIVASALNNVSHAITIGYGMTEAGVISFNMLKRIEDYTEGDCGRLFHGVQCRITDDSGNILPAGQTGNVEVMTDTLFEGFLRNIEKTKECFAPDGWFVTADLGFMSPGGTVNLVCRKGNVILHSSVLVYPTAIEIVLRKCPGVKDVVVVPIPHKVKHHNVCACVIRETGSDLTEAGLQKSMDDLLAVPRGPELVTPHHVIFVDSFPLVQNLKVDRKKIEKMAIDSILKQK